MVSHDRLERVFVGIPASNSTPQRTFRMLVIRKVLISEIQKAVDLWEGGRNVYKDAECSGKSDII